MLKEGRKKLLKLLVGVQKYFKEQKRDSRYVFVFLVSAFVFVITLLQALDPGFFDSVERPLFDAVNSLPTFLDGLMHAVTQLGGMASLIFWAGLAWYLVDRRTAIVLAASGVTAWFAAKFMKAIVSRGRPEELLETLRLFNDLPFGGYGFPSGHSTLVAACVAVLYFQVRRKYRKYLLLAALGVGISRIYLGAHFPLDVVGGWALGAMIGSAFCLIFGVSRATISAARIKSALNKKGYDIAHINYANVDARGSRPIFITDSSGKEFFGKLFGAQEHAADWLFKMYRFFRYKNLQGEEPYINSRRNIEMEAFATMWAKQSGLRVSKIVDMVKIGDNWLLIQEKLQATALDDMKKISRPTLVEAWLQIEKMHAANMAHRDLRAANVMVGAKGAIWLIDFGFAEVSPRKQRQYMDVAEFLMSTSLLVGVNRSVNAVMSVVDNDKLVRVLPYLKREVFSGATAKKLKDNKSLLQDLKDELKSRLDVQEEVEEANIVRISWRKVLNIALIALFLHFLLPQFSQFRGTLPLLGQVDPIWFIPITLASILTYLFSAGSIVALSSVPLSLRITTIVQLAASFVSKVIPSVGNTTLNLRYLIKSGNDQAESAAVLAANGVIGAIMFTIPLGLFLLLRGENVLSIINIEISARILIFVLIGLGIAGTILGFRRRLRERVAQEIANFATSIREFSNTPQEIMRACVSSFLVSISYILCLYICFEATGVQLSLGSAVLVYASAVIAKSVVPTPGGLGPLEIAMVTTMVGLGVPHPQALSAVILYRLATFWLPIPFSLLAYRYISNKKFI